MIIEGYIYDPDCDVPAETLCVATRCGRCQEDTRAMWNDQWKVRSWYRNHINLCDGVVSYCLRCRHFLPGRSPEGDYGKGLDNAHGSY